MALKSAVELSEFRPEIDEFLLEGKSGRFVSEWLKDKGESISHTAINKYKKKHLAVEKEAAIQYNEKKSKKKKAEKVKKVVSDLEALDDIIAEGQKVKLNIESICEDIEAGVSYVHIEKLKLDAKRLTIQAVKAKHDITKDEPPLEVNINLTQEKGLKRLKNIEARHNDSNGDSTDST
jgi:transposase